MSDRCWNYCSVCGRKIPVGEKCYGVKRSSSALVVGESICKDCIEPENFEIPASNVRPVVRGRWIEKYGHKLGEDKNYHIHAWNGVIGYTCSICGRFEREKEPFCNCGADMRGGGE